MYHEQLVKHNNLNTKMNLHNDEDNVNEGRKEVFPWTVIGLLFFLWTVNCVLFSSWTVNWPPLIFSVIRELSVIFFVNCELDSFIFSVIRD